VGGALKCYANVVKWIALIVKVIFVKIALKHHLLLIAIIAQRIYVYNASKM
jgi:hypothetical protein